MSNFIDGILQSIADYVETNLDDLYASIVFGSDPPYNGLCMIQSSGAPTDTHLDKGMIYRLPVVLNGKNDNQLTLLTDLTRIHEALTRKTDYADISTDDCQVIDIATTSTPSIIGRQQNSQWVCGSSFDVYFYWRM